VQVLDRLREDQVQALGVFTRRPAARRRARSGCSRVLGAEDSPGEQSPDHLDDHFWRLLGHEVADVQRPVLECRGLPSP
jgi:hypothetical protein